jgi:hypothetical protein
MLHHLTHHRSYWFCRHCWQEMPNLSDQNCDRTYSLADLPLNLINSQKVRLSSHF